MSELTIGEKLVMAYEADEIKHMSDLAKAIDEAVNDASSTHERWLLICSAPRDGSRVLLKIPRFSTANGEEPYIGIGHYSCAGHWFVAEPQAGGSICSPSHWQPLPI